MNTTLETTNADERGLVLRCPQCGQRNRVSYENVNGLARCGQCHTDLPPASAPIEVQSERAFDALVGQNAMPVLVDFWAPWCGPCKMVAPELMKVAAEGAGQWVVAKVNTEEVPQLAQRFGISAIPTLVLFKAGHELARQAGAMPAQTILEFMSAVRQV
jgi:thioredoxin 2